MVVAGNGDGWLMVAEGGVVQWCGVCRVIESSSI